MEDAVKIGISRDRRLVERFLKKLQEMVVPVPYGTWQSITLQRGSSLHIELQPAGHILGSSYVQCRVNTAHTSTKPVNVLFSGDLGAPYAHSFPHQNLRMGRISLFWNPHMETNSMKDGRIDACRCRKL